MVATQLSLKGQPTKLRIKLVLPTPLSPIMINLASRSCVSFTFIFLQQKIKFTINEYQEQILNKTTILENGNKQKSISQKVLLYIIIQMRVIRFSWGVLAQTVSYWRRNLGIMIREAGLDLDRRGSRMSRDIAYLQPINRHRTMLHLQGYDLAISKSAHIAPNATVYGNVAIARESYVGFGAVVDGLSNPVRIGANTKIGDNSTVQSAFWVPDEAFPLSTTIGNNVNIEHSCTVTNAIIDDNAHIGFGSVVMEGAQLERGVFVAPNSYVPAGSRLPENSLWAGNPVRFVKSLEPVEKRVGEEKNPDIRLEIGEDGKVVV